MRLISNLWNKALKYAESDRKARLFALVILAMIWLSAYFRWDSAQHYLPWLIGASVYPIASIFIPIILRPPLIIWLFFSGILGEISSFVMLSIVYFLFAWPLKFAIRKKPQTGWQKPEDNENDFSNLY